ncbi:MAG: hypothetical protein FJX52_13445 [Alphaproteobacteria bacterium]|nr:hypothetical protein [Alphaproteobacteria bacterium]
MAGLLALRWWQNADSYDVAMVASRLAARGVAVYWCTRAADGLEAGDYLIDAARVPAGAFDRLGLKASPWSAAERPDHALALSAARVALLGGQVSAYPYFGFAALALTRLGLPYRLVDGAAIARGALREANFAVLPGGFSTWGLDRGEGSPGADAEARAFLERGGVAIGACGGANYLSKGRPGWTGTAAAYPRFPHEYLYSGVGVVTLKIEDPLFGIGLPPTIDLPYYHGPIYEQWGEGVTPLARFHEHSFPGQLFIDNPLERPFFDRELRGRAAVLAADGPRGRAILLSPHPEMGDLVRKYMALDGYVRHYLPIRGKRVMTETLGFYRSTDAPSFRLFLNAARMLATKALPEPAAARPKGRGSNELPERVDALSNGVATALRDVGQGLGGDGHDDLVRDIIADLASRATAIPALGRILRDAAITGEIAGEWNNIAGLALPELVGEQVRNHKTSHRLMNIELVISLAEAWKRLAEVEQALAAVRPA